MSPPTPPDGYAVRRWIRRAGCPACTPVHRVSIGWSGGLVWGVGGSEGLGWGVGGGEGLGWGGGEVLAGPAGRAARGSIPAREQRNREGGERLPVGEIHAKQSFDQFEPLVEHRARQSGALRRE